MYCSHAPSVRDAVRAAYQAEEKEGVRNIRKRLAVYIKISEIHLRCVLYCESSIFYFNQCNDASIATLYNLGISSRDHCCRYSPDESIVPLYNYDELSRVQCSGLSTG